MSKKPCPGCGEVTLGRKATEVCFHCKDKLDKYEELETQIREINESSNKTEKIIIGSKPHWTEYLRLSGDTKGEFARAFQTGFYELVMASSNQSVVRHAHKEAEFLLGKTDGSYLPAANRLINSQVAKAIRELRKLVHSFAIEAYKAGQEDAADIRERYNKIREIIN